MLILTLKKKLYTYFIDCSFTYRIIKKKLMITPNRLQINLYFKFIVLKNIVRSEYLYYDWNNLEGDGYNLCSWYMMNRKKILYSNRIIDSTMSALAIVES